MTGAEVAVGASKHTMTACASTSSSGRSSRYTATLPSTCMLISQPCIAVGRTLRSDRLQYVSNNMVKISHGVRNANREKNG